MLFIRGILLGFEGFYSCLTNDICDNFNQVSILREYREKVVQELEMSLSWVFFSYNIKMEKFYRRRLTANICDNFSLVCILSE